VAGRRGSPTPFGLSQPRAPPNRIETHAVNKSAERPTSAVARAARELADLQRQAGEVRATLARLQQDVARAEALPRRGRTARLVEANEQLVLSALRGQTDVENAARALNEASRSAGLDALTKLPNRVLLLDRLAHAIALARRRKTRIALLFLDLDNFKLINDTLGHAVGDQVLKRAARCLLSSVREADTVSRHGGDEFLILLNEVVQASDAVLVADKVIATLGAESHMGDHAIRLTASIGISIFPDDGEDADILIDRADAAMYRAKRQGLGRFTFHDDAPASERAETEPPISARQQAFDHVLALAEHERRHAQMLEANAQLVLAAISAQQLQGAAEKAHQRQTHFLAMLAHELRNPLVPLSTAAEIMSRAPAGEPMPIRLHAIIERQVALMTRLVGDILDVSRVNTGKLRLERMLVEMAVVISSAVDTCRPAMNTRGQVLRVNVPSRALEVRGDPVRLAQVLCNLLDNASKYSPDAGTIELSAAVVDDTLVLTVADSGIGITPDALPEVFEPFVQEPHAIAFNGVGLGIGLTVVRELVEAHGGSVVARSAGAGLGSQFVVTLPLLGSAGQPA
jgi:diguanylate cyclase (GGDEF)-like protein